MEQKYMDKLYELLGKAKKGKETGTIAALRWAIFNLGNSVVSSREDTAMKGGEHIASGI